MKKWVCIVVMAGIVLGSVGSVVVGSRWSSKDSGRLDVDEQEVLGSVDAVPLGDEEKNEGWEAQLNDCEGTYFYWNAFLHLNGDLIGKPFYLPVRMDCVEGKGLWNSLKLLYKQQLRWGWGVLIMPIALQGMSWNSRIAIQRKIEKFLVFFRAYNFFLTASTLLSLSIPVMILINPNIEFSSITYSLPRFISTLLTFALILQIPAKYYLWKYYGSPPSDRSIWFKICWWLFEPLLMFVNIWTYYYLPRLQAIYELSVGKTRKKFFVAIEGRVDPHK